MVNYPNTQIDIKTEFIELLIEFIIKIKGIPTRKVHLSQRFDTFSLKLHTFYSEQ